MATQEQDASVCNNFLVLLTSFIFGAVFKRSLFQNFLGTILRQIRLRNDISYRLKGYIGNVHDGQSL